MNEIGKALRWVGQYNRHNIIVTINISELTVLSFNGYGGIIVQEAGTWMLARNWIDLNV